MTAAENKINKLFEELVPTSGKADTVAGEIIRAVSRVGYRWYNDGDMIGRGYGKETCNPAARYLAAKAGSRVERAISDMWDYRDENEDVDDYEDEDDYDDEEYCDEEDY